MAIPPPIDTRVLTRTGRSLEGRVEVAEMDRLASLLANDQGTIAWRLQGERRERADGGGTELMRLDFEGEVVMECVRCLGNTPVSIDAERSFRLVATEEEAEREDLEDPEYDVLVGDSRFDLAGLIEDEAILALPPMPRHEQCALPGSDDAAAAVEAGANGEDRSAEHEEGGGDRIRPFANLAELTRRGR
jgi:uncharacterized protein